MFSKLYNKTIELAGNKNSKFFMYGDGTKIRAFKKWDVQEHKRVQSKI